MSDKKKDRPWDGRSRLPTQHKTSPQNGSKPNNSFKKPDLSTNLQISAEIVNGSCPQCKQDTVLVSLWKNYIYRCMTCGADVKQQVNGKISYIPHVKDPKKFRYGMKIDASNG